jgi:hypothetical protein
MTKPLKIPPEQIGLLTWAVRDVISRRRLDGRASWATMHSLEALYHRITSADGSETTSTPEELYEDDLIDTTAAAAILGCSTRWIREIRADIDGRKVGGRWVFPRQVVTQYAELKGVGDDSNRIPRVGGGAVPERAA